ncbi:unnamed protein product [Lymnaea stagnalis]|uniref:Sulfotransferase domain-containing protein n=1 Tax=Lymnaea stagnalis TaxID=6523 RepID=A0AAV2HMA6_LYMST
MADEPSQPGDSPQFTVSSNKSVFDVDGHEHKVRSYDGKLVPPFEEKGYREMRDLQLRDDDILLCGYPKTGTHWTWEVVSMIVRKEGEISKVGKKSTFLELGLGKLMDGIPSPRVLSSHMWFDYLPKQISDKKTKLILTVRNPKDTAVSYHNHHVALKALQLYDGPFKNWFQLYMDGQVEYGTFFDYYKDWDNVIKSKPDLSILVVNYEDLKEDLPREIRKIADFLQISLDDQLVEDIAKAAGFEGMKKAYLDLKNFIFKTFFRKGDVGDWKNWFTVAQSERVDEAMKALQGTRFQNLRYTL